MTELVLSNKTMGWAFQEGTRAVNNAGEIVDRLFLQVARQVGRNIQDWDATVESEIAGIIATCSFDNWDGFGANAVLPSTIDQVRRVATDLYTFVPKGTPAPEVIPEADGEVALSWTRAPDKVFSISIGSHNKLNYAGRLAEGVEPHDAATFIPGNSEKAQYLALFIAQLFR